MGPRSRSGCSRTPTPRRSPPWAPSSRSSTTWSSPAQYWNKARNFAEARQLLPSDVFEATTQAEMPTSYWCTPVALTDAAQVVRTFSGTAGVLTVTEPQQTIHNEETVINVSKWVCLASRHRADRLGRRADPQHHPHGHLRPPTGGVGDEARRRHQLVHPGALHVRGSAAGVPRLVVGRGRGLLSSTSSSTMPAAARRRATSSPRCT